ncbi:MAG: 16S rRNA (uracil(1498)-N(3))-methyltransferase [Puniceicoccaceae bacterium]|nr:MAG: 16S rRNA (uracil(1498)-N(3))-methyltransferase [Puniceicoccaceae bacterium]
MADFRSYCRPPTLDPAEIRLSVEETRHLVQANRARPGDTVVAFDGEGNEWVCGLAETGRDEARLEVRFHQKARPLPYVITLAQALPKGKYMESIIRKATEIGVAVIQPLESERTIAQVKEGREETKLEKWRAAAVEAAKQCGNPFLPRIEAPRTASAFMQEPGPAYDLRLIASLHAGARGLKAVLENHLRETDGQAPARVVWMVGPEGDFTPAEMALSRSCGFVPVTLGPLVLRCETAAVYALSILSHELQHLHAAPPAGG